jgi:energy-coupling factor transport system permease protein
MRDISFGQYYPAESPIHRLDPRIKIIAVIIYITAIFFIPTGADSPGYAGFIIVFLFLATAVILSRVPVRLVLRSIRPLIFLVLFSVIINLFFVSGERPVFPETFPNGMTWEGVDFAAKMALRLIFLVMGPALLTLTTPPVTLTDGIEKMLRPLRVIRFPVHELAIIMSIALRLIPTIMEETDKIILAQKARCAAFDSRNIFKKARALLPVLIPLFVSSLRRADELAYAMDSRCYHGGKGRTKMKVLKYKWRDLFAFLAVSALLVALLFLRYNWADWHFIEWLNILEFI